MHPAPVSASLSLCENKTGHHDWYFPVDFSSHRSRPVLLWSFLFFLYFLLWFSALCMCCAVCAHVCVCEKQHALFTQNLWTWNQAMIFCVGNRCVWGGGVVIRFVNGCGIQPVSVSAKHNQHRGGFSNPCLLSTLQNESTSHLLSLQNDRAQGNPCSRMPSPCVNCIKMISTFIPLLFSSDELYGCRLLYPPLVMLQWCN